MGPTRRHRPLVSDADALLAMAPMPSRGILYRKLARSCAIATSVIGGGLLLGMVGYHNFGHVNWSESFYYASMILAGEGPPADPTGLSAAQVGRLHLFAGVYALFSVAVGLLGSTVTRDLKSPSFIGVEKVTSKPP